MHVWNPTQYLRHGGPRLRPALDLLTQAAQSVANPNTVSAVLDYGCGPGNITPYLCRQFPTARIHGIDSSKNMISRAQTNLSTSFLSAYTANSPTVSDTLSTDACDNDNDLALKRVSYEVASMEDYVNKELSENEKFDVVYSNAALHWLPNHDVVMTKLLINTISKTREGGVLAVQMPDTKNQPSHVLMETAALKSGLVDKIQDVRIPRASHTIDHYFKLLSPLCREVNIWSTEYLQQLKYSGRANQAQHPVLEFTKATGLLPILEALGGENSPDGRKYIREYDMQLTEQYPVSHTHQYYTHGENVVLFPFRRLFIVCRV